MFKNPNAFDIVIIVLMTYPIIVLMELLLFLKRKYDKKDLIDDTCKDKKHCSKHSMKNMLRMAIMGGIIAFLFGVLIKISDFPTVLSFLYLFIYFIVSILFAFVYKGRKRIMIVLFIYWLPVVVFVLCGLICYLYIILTINQYNNPMDVASYVNNLTTYYTRWCYSNCPYQWLGQVQHVYSWILFGYAKCGGIANVVKELLSIRGVEAYLAQFPGEDHTFVVVNINDSWHVVDPGYFSKPIPIDDRIRFRLKEFGNVSYMVMYFDNGSFIELTDKFPSLIRYDTIVIKVVKNNTPVAGACVVLVHKFQGRTTSLPGNGLCFHTNGNGEVIVHLGVPKYNSKAGDYEPYFWIYVNDVNSGKTVTSTGTNTTHYVTVSVSSK